MIRLLLRGLMLGLAIAAPVGPIGLLCIQRTLSLGMPAGFAAGLGAATADGLYGLAAVLGLAGLAAAAPGTLSALRLVGAAVLVWLAWTTLSRAPATRAAAPAGAGSLVSGYAATLLLTLANPATIFSFIAIFAGLGIEGGSTGAAALVLGVFLGSAGWWLVLSSSVGLIRRRVPESAILWINRLSALLLLGFAAVAAAPLLHAL
jgi:threonine/homoserine/homoserine lactone efflux protein